MQALAEEEAHAWGRVRAALSRAREARNKLLKTRLVVIFKTRIVVVLMLTDFSAPRLINQKMNKSEQTDKHHGCTQVPQTLVFWLQSAVRQRRAPPVPIVSQVRLPLAN